jgi:hypothetical protein
MLCQECKFCQGNQTKKREQWPERSSVNYRTNSDKVSSEKQPREATHTSSGPASAGRWPSKSEGPEAGKYSFKMNHVAGIK